eukprot:COSAG06_NODE_167_length_21546_cov_35.001352_5_plen_69_part_00
MTRGTEGDDQSIDNLSPVCRAPGATIDLNRGKYRKSLAIYWPVQSIHANGNDESDGCISPSKHSRHYS